MAFFKTIFAAATALLITGGAQAATLGLLQKSEPQVLDAAADVLRAGDEFIISSSAATTTVGFATAFPPFFTLTASVDAGGMIGAPGGALVLTDFDSFDVTGTLVAFGSVFDPLGEDRLEFLFDQDAGDPAFGPQILAIFTGDFDNILTTPTFVSTGDATIAPVIPLPAGVLLLGSALGVMALRRRRT